MKNKFLILTAMHGDERIGPEVMEKIEKKLPRDHYGYDWIIANEKAFKKNIRFTEVDLNRNAPGNIHSPVYEEKRAAELVELSKNYDFIIDVHGSISNCGILSIITHSTLQNLVLASCLEVEKNVIWYSKSSLVKGPVTQFTHCPAIEIECGPRGDSDIQHKLKDILIRFIIQSKQMNFSETVKKGKNTEFYVVYGKQIGDHDSNVVDFQETTIKGETFYPFLTNEYPNILCYKTKKIDIKNYFLY